MLYRAVSLLFICTVLSADTPFPLESVAVEGTSLSKEFVMEIAGLRVGTPVDKAAMEAACVKLQESGIFGSIGYRYAPGPKKGYALTLTVADQGRLTDAVIDVPGVNEDEAWKWLTSQYPVFNHKVPGNDAAQQFIAKKLEQHLGPKLDGQHVVARMEAELVPRSRTIISFQPETLPRVSALSFTGQKEFSSDELTRLIQKIVTQDGYTDRHFQNIVEQNIRRAYEEHGMYRVRFPSITAQRTGDSVAVVTAIEEGPKFTLGDVQLVGDNLPAEAMLKAAKFRRGEIANWTEIQNGIWAMERPLKRTGYTDAASHPERVLHDDSRVLDVKVGFYMGPLYKFGEVQFAGLPPSLESEAKKQWKMQTGAPFDFMYAGDFLRAFFQSVDPRQFKRYDTATKRHPNEPVVDMTVIFEKR